MSSESGYLDPVVREPTTHIIARKLRAAISHGQLSAGEQLSEVRLAKSLGISRGPLREALQRLSQEGLVVSPNGRGLYVAAMGPEDVLDVYRARRAVEHEALAVIFQGDCARAGRALMEQVDDDMGFHQTLVALAASARLTRIHDTLVTETLMCVHMTPEGQREVDERTADHRSIAEMVTSNRPEEADRTLMQHLDQTARRLAAIAPQLT